MNPNSQSFSAETLHQTLRLHQLQQILVAYSGGLDSHVLLHSLATLRAQYPHLKIRALHINHGLNPKAHSWGLHCLAICKSLDVECRIITVDVKQHLAGQSLEEAARNLRYEALAKELQAGECLMVAHTQDDQAETLLLQLLRGAGVKGLAAMPLAKKFANSSLVRPLLHVTRHALQRYAQLHKLSWIEDESNAATTLDRNYLRHRILPELASRWPGVKKVLSRVAQHCGEASQLIDELALQDLAAVTGSVRHTLSVTALSRLSLPRQKNVLRFWLRCLHLPVPNARQLAQLQQDFLCSQPDAAPKMTWPGVEIRRFADDLYALQPLPSHDATAVFCWDLSQTLVLPNLGTLSVTYASVGLEIPMGAKVTIRFRCGGERFYPTGRNGSHPLKKLFQEWKVPPWLRDRVPLIYFDEELVAVANYAISKKYLTPDHRRGLGMLVEFNPGV